MSAEPSPESRPEDGVTKAWSSVEHGARGNTEKLECTGVLGIQFLLFVYLGSKEELVFLVLDELFHPLFLPENTE